MKKPFLRDLQSKLLGSVTDTQEVLDYFSMDAGIYRQAPQAVVYPKNTADVRRAVLAAAERTAAGKPLAITARGLGSGTTGAALTDGLVLSYPAHMNKVMDMDRRTITVQPGANFQTVQQLLHAQARFLPAYPSSIGFSTIGGAVASNASGVKSVKYGSMRKYVRRVKAVLADGSLVAFGRISPRQLHRKKGQPDLEGDIYRKVDTIVTDHRKLIHNSWPKTALNNAGYSLNRVKGSDGSLDLSQLLIGSQGTLAQITEITLETVAWNPRVSLVVGYFDDLDHAGEAIAKLRELEPSGLEFVDGRLIELARKDRAEDLSGLVPETAPKIVLLVEFDDLSQLTQLRKLRRAQKVLGKYAAALRTSENVLEQEALWRIRQASATAMWQGSGSAQAAPVVGDAAVPPDKLVQLLNLADRMFSKYDLDYVTWGHAGTGQAHFQPLFGLDRRKDRDALPNLLKDYHEIVISLGGTISAAHGDGLIRGPYLKDQYGQEVYDLMKQIKEAFDPQGIFNPGVKFGTDEDVAGLLRDEYRLKQALEFWPAE